MRVERRVQETRPHVRAASLVGQADQGAPDRCRKTRAARPAPAAVEVEGEARRGIGAGGDIRHFTSRGGVHGRRSLPARHGPESRDPTTAGPVEDGRLVPRRLRRWRADRLQCGAADTGHVGIARRIVDRERGGGIEAVTVLRAAVAGGGHEALALGCHLLEDQLLTEDQGRSRQWLTQTPARRDGLGGVVVCDLRVLIEGRGAVVGRLVDIDGRIGRQPGQRLDVQRGLTRLGKPVGPAVDRRRGDVHHRVVRRYPVTGLERPDVTRREGLELEERDRLARSEPAVVVSPHIEAVGVGDLVCGVGPGDGRRQRARCRARRGRDELWLGPGSGAAHHDLRLQPRDVRQPVHAHDQTSDRRRHLRGRRVGAGDASGGEVVTVDVHVEGRLGARHARLHRDHEIVRVDRPGREPLRSQRRGDLRDRARRCAEARPEVPLGEVVVVLRGARVGHLLHEGREGGGVARREDDVDRQRRARDLRPQLRAARRHGLGLAHGRHRRRGRAGRRHGGAARAAPAHDPRQRQCRRQRECGAGPRERWHRCSHAPLGVRPVSPRRTPPRRQTIWATVWLAPPATCRPG